jgi:hypothetical protein
MRRISERERPAERVAAPVIPPAAPHALLGLQRSAGNQAVCRMLSRSSDGAGGATGAGPVATGAEGTSGVDPQAAPDDATVRWFEAQAASPFQAKLIRHYAYGGGEPYDWTLEDMQAIGKLDIDVFDPDRFPTIEPVARRLAAAVAPVPMQSPDYTPQPASEAVSGRGVHAAPVNSVGGFSVIVRGTLTATARPEPALPEVVFEGVMEWTDTWDFDTRWMNRLKGLVGSPDYKEDTRTLAGEIKTTGAALLLPGKAFELRTASYPVRQVRFASLEWDGA